MVRFFILIVVGAWSYSCLSQSGYLGKLNSVELKIGVVPTIGIYSTITGNITAKKAKLINSNVMFSYTRVLAKNFEIGAGYFYSNIQCTSESYFFKDEPSVNYYDNGNYYTLRLLDEPQLTHQGGYLAFNFYRLGCLAPVGKYVGFSLSYGITTIDTTDYIVVGERSSIAMTSDFFKTTYAVNGSNSEAVSELTKMSSTHLKLRLGRNYPLNKFLMLSIGMTMPIFSVYKSNYYRQFGFRLDRGSNDLLEYDYNSLIKFNWMTYAAKSIKSYHQITFEASLRFAF